MRCERKSDHRVAPIGTIDPAPAEHGSYLVEGTTVVITKDDGEVSRSPYCASGDQLMMGSDTGRASLLLVR